MDAVVWWARPDATSDALLTDDELARLRALRRPVDRASFRSAHVLTRLLVAEETRAAPEDVVLWAECTRCGGPHGAPRVDVRGEPGPQVTLSRCEQAVVAAVSSSTIGIDIEPLGRPRPGLAEVALSPAEIEQLHGVPADERDDVLTRWWVRKEAVLKAARTGLDADPRTVEVAEPSNPRVLASSSSGLRDGSTQERGGFALIELELDPKLAACLAVGVSGPVSVDVRRVELS